MVEQNNVEENIDSLLARLNHHASLIGSSDNLLRKYIQLDVDTMVSKPYVIL